MNKLVEMQDYFSSIPPESIFGLTLNIFLVILLSSVLSKMYLIYGQSFSDRKLLSRVFVMLSLITMLVISVVKSSLALSLGLVGALSIVRFRTPIKEPEDLAYLFFAIAIGLGMGAASRQLTVVVSVIIFLYIYYRAKKYNIINDRSNLSLTISGNSNLDKFKHEEFVDIIKSSSSRADITRFESSEDYYELAMYIEIDHFKKIEDIRNNLLKIDNKINIVFIDNGAGKLI